LGELDGRSRASVVGGGSRKGFAELADVLSYIFSLNMHAEGLTWDGAPFVQSYVSCEGVCEVDFSDWYMQFFSQDLWDLGCKVLGHLIFWKCAHDDTYRHDITNWCIPCVPIQSASFPGREPLGHAGGYQIATCLCGP
jgi:hypothetical protein